MSLGQSVRESMDVQIARRAGLAIGRRVRSRSRSPRSDVGPSATVVFCKLRRSISRDPRAEYELQKIIRSDNKLRVRDGTKGKEDDKHKKIEDKEAGET